ncbi:MAG: hypothetical protein ACREOZ_03820 [Gloeomargaritales cyanobacterium]
MLVKAPTISAHIVFALSQCLNAHIHAVDGIYPRLSRFVQSISEPDNQRESVYVKWQEACRKDIERAFGVLQRKFHLLRSSVECHTVRDIQDLTMACIMLHNMMVEERVAAGEGDNVNFYEIGEDSDQEGSEEEPDTAEQNVIRDENEVINHLNEVENNDAPVSISILERSRRIDLLPRTMRIAQERWSQLNDSQEHVRLRSAIIREVHQLPFNNN